MKLLPQLYRCLIKIKHCVLPKHCALPLQQKQQQQKSQWLLLWQPKPSMLHHLFFSLLLCYVLISPKPISAQVENLAGAVQARTPQAENQAEDIVLKPGDLYIENKPGDEGVHLWVANKPSIGSILITDYTQDPEKEQPVYALRSSSYNIYNGSEKRMLDGKFLPKGLHSLVDSTPESNPYFPRGAFHVFIPFTVVYGYPWSRSGSRKIGKGTWLNIRSFSKAYADYRGPFQDNPFELSMESLPENIEAQKTEVAEVIAEPKAPLSPAAKSLLENLDQKIDELSRNSIDVALVLDTTISMRDNVEFLKTELIPLVEQKAKSFESIRVGVVLYRDYSEEYLAKPFAFTSDLKQVQKVLDGIVVHGGGDKAEAVYEGIYAALTQLQWRSNKRLVIQVRDAPAHKRPKGKITPTMVEGKRRELLVQLQKINLNDIESQHDAKSLANDRSNLALQSRKSKR